MTFTVSNASEFKIKELSIVTKGGVINISALYEELNIFDCIFLPIMSGNILVTDSIGLTNMMKFDGSEVLLIEVEKSTDQRIASFKKSFRIYKQTDRKNINQTSEKYILHFVSDEMIFSDQQRVNQSYETTYSEVVKKIMTEYLKITSADLGLQEDTYGIKKIVVPNLSPLDAIDWCARRSVDIKNSPNFLFFRNNIGFNFATLSNLLALESILNIKFDPKNLNENNALDEISTARSFEVISENDLIDKTRSGVNAGRFIGFDPMTRTFGDKEVTFDQHYNSMNHGNKYGNATEIFNRDGSTTKTTVNSRKVVSIYGMNRKYSSYIKKKDPESINKIEDYENFAFQRKAILKNLVAKRIKLVMPGNFQLTSGFNVNITTPGFSQSAKYSDNQDSSIMGKYLIIATRHIITNSKHETVMEVVTDSTNSSESLVSSPQQNEALKAFTR